MTNLQTPASVSQIIFTSHAGPSLSHDEYVAIGVKNDAICKSLGLTGRLFVVEREHLNIIEGPTEFVENFYRAFVTDPRATSTILHDSRDVSAREFADYSVWVSHTDLKNPPAELNLLTADNLNAALSPHLSTKVRVLIDAYIGTKL